MGDILELRPANQAPVRWRGPDRSPGLFKTGEHLVCSLPIELCTLETHEEGGGGVIRIPPGTVVKVVHATFRDVNHDVDVTAIEHPGSWAMLENPLRHHFREANWLERWLAGLKAQWRLALR